MERNVIDPWTVIHAVVGLNVGLLVKSRLLGYFLIIGYEAIENKYLIGPIFENQEGILNILSDIVVGLGTYEIGRKYGNKKI